MCFVKSLAEVVLISEKELKEGVFVNTRANTNATAVSVGGCGGCLPRVVNNVVGIGGNRAAGVPAKLGLGIVAANGNALLGLIGC